MKKIEYINKFIRFVHINSKVTVDYIIFKEILHENYSFSVKHILHNLRWALKSNSKQNLQYLSYKKPCILF